MNELYYIIYVAYDLRKHTLPKPRAAVNVATERTSMILVLFAMGILRYIGLFYVIPNTKQAKELTILSCIIIYILLYSYYTKYGEAIVERYKSINTWSNKKIDSMALFFLLLPFFFLLSYDLLNLFIKLPLIKYFNK
jgi:hypothetical protein